VPPDSESDSWWKTLPGMLTAFAGVLTATTGLLIALHQIRGSPVDHNAPDICTSLQGKSLTLNANGHDGVIAPTGIRLSRDTAGIYHFETVASFLNEPADPVSGACKDGRLDFVRTRRGAFTQAFGGAISETGQEVEGHFSHNSIRKNWAWTARITEPTSP
jgi:hypothetical protein